MAKSNDNLVIGTESLHKGHFLPHGSFPVGKIAEKAVYRSILLTIWHCIVPN